MSVNIGNPPERAKTPFEEWAQRSLHAIAQDMRNNDVSVVTDAFSLVNIDAVTENYVLDQSAASTTDVRNVLATFLKAFAKRGRKGL